MLTPDDILNQKGVEGGLAPAGAVTGGISGAGLGAGISQMAGGGPLGGGLLGGALGAWGGAQLGELISEALLKRRKAAETAAVRAPEVRKPEAGLMGLPAKVAAPIDTLLSKVSPETVRRIAPAAMGGLAGGALGYASDKEEADRPLRTLVGGALGAAGGDALRRYVDKAGPAQSLGSKVDTLVNKFRNV